MTVDRIFICVRTLIHGLNIFKTYILYLFFFSLFDNVLVLCSWCEMCGVLYFSGTAYGTKLWII